MVQRAVAGSGNHDALGAARWALVDLGLTPRDRLRVGRAVGKTAARALGLGQGGIDAPGEFVHASDGTDSAHEMFGRRSGSR